jgi:hypothetical protein
VPLLLPEVDEFVVAPELEVVAPELEVVAAELFVVVAPELVVAVGPLDVPPAPPVAAGALEPHPMARPESAARICRARTVKRVVRIMSINSSS